MTLIVYPWNRPGPDPRTLSYAGLVIRADEDGGYTIIKNRDTGKTGRICRYEYVMLVCKFI